MKCYHIDNIKKYFLYKNVSVGHHNTEYSQAEIINSIIQLCKHRETIGEFCSTPSSDTIYRRLELDINELVSSFQDVTFPVLSYFARMYPRERWELIFDSTEDLFYGKKGDEWVMGTKEGKMCFRFKQIILACRKIRIPIAIVPVKKGTDKVKLLEPILRNVLKIVVPFNVLADAGYGDGATLKLLQGLRLNFVIKVKVAGKIKRYIKEGKTSEIHSFELEDKSQVYFHVKCGEDEHGNGWALATSHCNSHTNHLWKWYSKRWEIENAFKTQDRVQFKTASRYCKMRLFAQMVSALLYLMWNLWRLLSNIYYTIKQFVRLIVCILIFGSRAEKHELTIKYNIEW
jgi:hypothetical protein